MARFTSYPNKSKPADSDTLLINDASASANKQILLSGLFAWLKDKFASSTISELYTTDKTIVGAINELKEDLDNIEGGGGSGDGLTSEVKDALLAIFQHVVYADSSGQTYYDALEEALYPTVTTRTVSYSLSHVTSSNNASTVTSGASYTATLTASSGYTINTVTVTMGGIDVTSTVYSSGTITIPSVTGNVVITATAVAAVSSISAVYTQSGTVYDTDTLNSLKSDLVVTATYSNSSTATVPSSDYTLSGTLTSGTSTITVSYGGKTTTFTVTVTAWDVEWDYTDGTPIGNGWINTTTVTGTMQNTGYQMGPVNSGTSGCTLAHSPDVEYSHGVIEIDFTIVQMAITTGQYQGYCIFAPGVRFRIYDNKLYVDTSTTNTYADRIQIGTMSEGERYILRFEYNKTAGGVVVWVNGVKIYETDVALNASATRLLMNATQKDITGNKYQDPAPATLLHAIRCKEVA